MSDSAIQERNTVADMRWPIVAGVLCFLGMLALIGLGVALLIKSNSSGLAWMTIAGGGVLLVVSIMILVAVVYRVMGVHDSKQALGMPQGSVRSLLMFLIFTLLGVFVFFSVDSIGEKYVETTMQVPFDANDNSWKAQVPQGAQLKSSGVVSVKALSPEGKPIMVSMREIVYEQARPASEAVAEHINQIAIALFSMASSIIGYYFGTRSQIPPLGRDAEKQDEPVTPTPAPATPAGENDSPDWSIGAAEIKLTPKDGEFVGSIDFASDELADGHRFAGMIVPPEGKRKLYEDFKVTVTRKGQTLSVEISGPDTPSLTGQELSLYPVDHEDVAQAVKMA